MREIGYRGTGPGSGVRGGGVEISASCCDLTSTASNLTASVREHIHTRTHAPRDEIYGRSEHQDINRQALGTVAQLTQELYRERSHIQRSTSEHRRQSL